MQFEAGIDPRHGHCLAQHNKKDRRSHLHQADRTKAATNRHKWTLGLSVCIADERVTTPMIYLTKNAGHHARHFLEILW